MRKNISKSKDHIYYILLYLFSSIFLLLIIRSYIKNFEIFLWFILFNIFLAIIPLLLFHTCRYIKNKFFLYFLAFIGFIFLPNTLYLVTDSIHIKFWSNSTVLTDTLLYTLVWLFWIISWFKSIEYIEFLFFSKSSKILKYVILLVIFFLISLWIMFWRMLRWNSWDIISNPTWVLVESRNLLFAESVEINDNRRLNESKIIGWVWAPVWLLIFEYWLIFFYGYINCISFKNSLRENVI